MFNTLNNGIVDGSAQAILITSEVTNQSLANGTLFSPTPNLSWEKSRSIQGIHYILLSLNDLSVEGHILAMKNYKCREDIDVPHKAAWPCNCLRKSYKANPSPVPLQ
uniref:Uncharacterized protein n=1 Tax=Opuntia streptacantha TaxID=393608 RepID=A0A7C9EM92_OPUST